MIAKFLQSSRFKGSCLSCILLSYFIFVSGISVHYSFGQGNTSIPLQETNSSQTGNTTSTTASTTTNANSLSTNQTLVTNNTLGLVNNSNSSVLFSGVGYPPQSDPGANQEVKQGQWVTLNGTNSYDPEGGNLTYSWSQVSGKEVDLEDDDQAMSHFRAPTVSQDSILKFTLLVEDENGDIGKNSVYVTVKADSMPHADAGGDQTVNEGEYVTLDGDGSYSPDGSSLDYSWTQTSGDGVDLQDDNQPSAHFYAPYVYDDQTLKFELRVEDSNGNSDESTISVKVENSVDSNSKPHADAGSDQTVNEGQWVTLDGDGSSDPDGSSLDYSWTQTSGPSVDLENDDEAEANFRAPYVSEDTTLHFSLVVEDDQGNSDEDSVSVKVDSIENLPDNLPCVQTYDTSRGTYVTNCENGGGGTVPILPPCNVNGLNPPNCQPLPPCQPGQQNRPDCNPLPPCQPGQQNRPDCNPVPLPGPIPGPEPGPVPPCNPGGISPPNCAPGPTTLKPGSETKKIVNKPVTQNSPPVTKKIVNKPVTQKEPKQLKQSQLKQPKQPQLNQPKQPSQKFKPPKNSGFSPKKRQP
jgi:K319-like protein